MSKEELHELASNSTPEFVNIPQTWGGLFVWAAGKWGVGIVFAAMLIPVYADLKASNQRLADVAQANVQVLTVLAHEIKSISVNVEHLEDSVGDLESRILKQ